MNNILIVDDEQIVLDSLEKILTLEHFSVRTARGGKQALEQLKQGGISLMILDLSMPDMNGMEVLDQAQKISPNTQIIILTAHGSMESAIQALRFRVLDYLVKPLEPQEIIDHVRKAMREGKSGSDNKHVRTIIFDEAARKYYLRNQVEVDIDRRLIVYPGGKISLTPTETKLIESMLDRYGQVISHSELVKDVHGYSIEQDEAAKIIRPIICRLRMKLSAIEGAEGWMENIRGRGYIFEIKGSPA